MRGLACPACPVLGVTPMENLEHICPKYRTVTRSIPGGAPIYLPDTMWFENGQWWIGEEDVFCPVWFCPFCGVELKTLETLKVLECHA